MKLEHENYNYHFTNKGKEDRIVFSMQSVGRKINQLRKNANMTQMELADKLGISYQAVSNWERGESMPDISKLPELAEILNTSIDELLGDQKQARILNNIIEDKQQQEVTPEEFVGVVPLLKPNQAERLFEEVQGEFSFDQIALAAPFLNQEFIDSIAKRIISETGRLRDVCEIAPFISDRVIDEMAAEVFEKTSDLEEIAAMAPFISEEALNDIAGKVLDKSGNPNDLVVIAPFLSSAMIDECALKAVETGSAKEIAGIAPFISDEKLNEIALYILKTSGLKGLTPILPFLDNKVIEDEIEKLTRLRPLDRSRP